VHLHGGTTLCSDGCANLQEDSAHCGTCDHACGSYQECVRGECSCVSSAQKLCDGNCVDLESDHDNCGSCDLTCSAAQHCSRGSCVANGTGGSDGSGGTMPTGGAGGGDTSGGAGGGDMSGAGGTTVASELTAAAAAPRRVAIKAPAAQ